MTPDDVLSTTRAVRRRLDLTRPVPRELIEECLKLAVQAPTGRNRQRWHFVVVTERGQRERIAALWREGMNRPGTPMPEEDARRAYAFPGSMERVWEGADHLYRHIHQVPAFLIPCITGRTEGASAHEQANTFGSILPAVWSFMLAARARSLGTAWLGPLRLEREAAQVLGIPYGKVMQVAFVPLAYTIGTDFKPARRVPMEEVTHWDRW
ncbi:nitroreductase family protein [Streptosporangium sp. NPDC001681]|uniref:nitroreductase family protein n=1 Tax=Streptosporangium sp. NPDC001681 TaxID=3154395 RepID=UPI0033280C69